MAHYIAELIKKAENATDENERIQAQSKCCETIIKLWEHRAVLSNDVSPLANLKTVFKAIVNLRDNNKPWRSISRGKFENEGPWITFIEELENIGVRMSRIAFLTAVAEANFGEEKCWLKDHGEMLSKDEINIIKLLDAWLSEDTLWLSESASISSIAQQVSIGELGPEERNKRVLEELELLVNKINDSFEDLKNKIQQ